LCIFRPPCCSLQCCSVRIDLSARLNSLWYKGHMYFKSFLPLPFTYPLTTEKSLATDFYFQVSKQDRVFIGQCDKTRSCFNFFSLLLSSSHSISQTFPLYLLISSVFFIFYPFSFQISVLHFTAQRPDTYETVYEYGRTFTLTDSMKQNSWTTWSTNSLTFTKYKSSLPYSQEPPTCTRSS
jgi:hypothetical protein